MRPSDRYESSESQHWGEERRVLTRQGEQRPVQTMVSPKAQHSQRSREEQRRYWILPALLQVCSLEISHRWGSQTKAAAEAPEDEQTLSGPAQHHSAAQCSDEILHEVAYCQRSTTAVIELSEHSNYQ